MKDWGEFDIHNVVCNRCNYRKYRYFANDVKSQEHELDLPVQNKRSGKYEKKKQKVTYTYVECSNCGAKIVLSDRDSKGEYVMVKFIQ